VVCRGNTGHCPLTKKETGGKMADEVKSQPSQQELEAQLREAMQKGDMATVVKIASQLNKAAKTRESAELEAKKTQITDLAEKVKVGFVGLIDRFGADIVALVGEKKAIINLSWSYEEQLPTVKIVKGSSTVRKTGGGGNPQKFDMKTEDMLATFGSQEYKDGVSFNDAWAATTDKNVRYAIRKKLIKLQTGG